MNTRPPAQIHQLRENAREGSPHRLLFFDCEARAELQGDREVQLLRLWAARLVNRHGRRPREPRFQDFYGWSGENLIELVEKVTRAPETCWIFAHNLAYDLTVSRLLLRLLEAGWTISRHNLVSDSPWAILKRGSRTLRLADSWSWLPVGVEKLGGHLQVAKPPLPAADAPEADWLLRARRDTEITARAIEGLMDEWDRRKLGWWSLTGPATAWNSMLHLTVGPRAVIDPDPEARTFERQAIMSGRRDISRVGELEPGAYAYLDFKSAHLAVCAHFQLPIRRGQRFDRLPLDHDWLDPRFSGLVAEVELAAQRPRYPVRFKHAILHPTGRFRTVLCGPEILEARRRGELVAIGKGYRYRPGNQMTGWAGWAHELLVNHPEQADPVFLEFLRMASRTVPGRWGMLVTREGFKGPSHLSGWGLETAIYGAEMARGSILHLNGEWTEQIRDQEADDSFPAVLAYVQSWVRLLLHRAIDVIGEDDVLQVNTDALLVPTRRLVELGRQAVNSHDSRWSSDLLMETGLRSVNLATAPLQLRIKKLVRHVELLSPQHLRLDGVRHFAGVPASAQEYEPGRFAFWTWPKLKGQLENGSPEGYVREQRLVSLNRVPVSRWAYECGCAEPVQAALGADGGLQILRPLFLPACGHQALLRANQHPILRPLLV